MKIHVQFYTELLHLPTPSIRKVVCRSTIIDTVSVQIRGIMTDT